MNNQFDSNSAMMKKLKLEICIIIILMACLCITTVALAFSTVTTRNTFQTDAIDIILNNGQKIMSEKDQLISPGKTITTTFPLKNNSDHEIYYRLYFYNIKDGEGNLADYLEVKILRADTGEILYDGVMPDLIYSTAAPIKEPIHANEEIMLEATFFLPESAKNHLQGEGVTFDFVAEAVQAENNEDMNFGNDSNFIDPDEILEAVETDITDDTETPEDGDQTEPSETTDSESEPVPESSVTNPSDVVETQPSNPAE